MILPNAHRALVEREKIIKYLLNPAHPDNGGKAPFFIALGFQRKNWELFADALRQLALNGIVSDHMETVHGKKYIIDGAIETITGKRPVVRTVWIIDRGADVPRLITAYPHEE
ncbi:MAG TPA: hypothetical protein VJT82_09940 [Pyrinomonadaceae bacterium]|nr:hypothetical protein [Pyrinomonadaceae bacterium]